MVCIAALNVAVQTPDGLHRLYQHDSTWYAVARGIIDFQIDYRVVWSDGSVRWVANRGQVHRGKSHEGTGLGLSISHGIIKEHGGRITLATSEGEGSTFTIALPLVPSTKSSPVGSGVYTGATSVARSS